MAGNAPCSPCPARSHALAPAAPVCPCLEGFFRASSDPPEAPCTGESPTHPRDGIGMQWGQERVSLRAQGWLVGICSDFFLLCPCFLSPPPFPAAPLRPTCSLPPLPPSFFLPPSPPPRNSLLPGPCPPHTRGLPRPPVSPPGAVVRGAGLCPHAALAPASGAWGPRGPALQRGVQGVRRGRGPGPLSPL